MQCVVTVGGIYGFEIYGPFTTEEDAEEWVGSIEEDYSGDAVQVVELLPTSLPPEEVEEVIEAVEA